MRHAKLCFHVHQPDYSTIPIPEQHWKKTTYGEVKKLLPNDTPPLGEETILMTYADANLCHDFTTGRSVTRILHLVNQTVKQPVVQTATYGSEHMAARTAMEQIIEEPYCNIWETLSSLPITYLVITRQCLIAALILLLNLVSSMFFSPITE